MIGRIHAVVAAFCLLAATSFSAQAEPRFALVVGNSNYGPEIGKLPNPVNDAGVMAQALTQTGFQVTKVTDVDQQKLKRAIIEFGDKLTAAGENATALFFYAGHGVQVKGMNYLIPVGADIGKESDVGLEAISADEVLQQMEYAGARVNIVILDACRNNPLARGFRSASRGLAPMDATRGTFIAYSTSPGDVSADGDGKNSPYSAALAKTIVQPGIGIEEAFRDVRAQVMSATDEKQVPWDSSSLTAPFFFQPSQFNTASQAAPAPAAAPKAAANTSAPANIEIEKAVWDGIKDSKQAGDYQAYLDQYPNGIFAQVARSRVASLGGGSGAPREQPAAPVVEPAAAVIPEPAPAPAPVPQEASTTDAAAAIPVSAEPAEVLDSRGVSCKVKDMSRSEADIAKCKQTTRRGANGSDGGGGSKSTGSTRWQ
ncbi:caspase domain-containing protein [Dongia sp.]|uniref:caspase family protein n=1 Tax=Dongia sp. TaxID=1977262 RepID=UPI003751353F